MTARKERLTVTVDRTLIESGNAAVAMGRADSLSGWVNLALEERAAKERRLQAMADAVAAYEAEFGVIADGEMTAQARRDRASAIVVRGRRKRPSKTGRRRGAA
jgi:hypothetical protein